jgi:hypothetical protein
MRKNPGRTPNRWRILTKAQPKITAQMIKGILGIRSHVHEPYLGAIVMNSSCKVPVRTVSIKEPMIPSLLIPILVMLAIGSTPYDIRMG